MTILRRVENHVHHYVECPVCKKREYTQNTISNYYHYVLTDDDNELVQTVWDSGSLDKSFYDFNGEVIEMDSHQLDRVRRCTKCGGTV